jgi:hypothetical protein
MKHRGEILKAAIDTSGVKKPQIIEALKISLSKLYRMFEDPFVSFDDLIAIGKIIRHDFSNDFPEIANPDKLKAAQDNLDYKLKYFELLEKHLAILEERQEKYEKDKKKK